MTARAPVLEQNAGGVLSLALIPEHRAHCAWCGQLKPISRLTRVAAVRPQGRVHWYLLRCAHGCRPSK